MSTNRITEHDWNSILNASQQMYDIFDEGEWDDYITEETSNEIKVQLLENDEIKTEKTQGGDNITNFEMYLLSKVITFSWKAYKFYQSKGRTPTKEELIGLIPKCSKEYLNTFILNIDFFGAILSDMINNIGIGV